MMLLLILLAKPIFILLYSDKWLDSVPYFRILCLAGIAICLQGVNYQAIAAVGKSKAMFNWTLIKRAIGLTLVVGGLVIGKTIVVDGKDFGIEGLLVGMVLQSWVIYLINASLVNKYIGYKLFTQLLDLVPIFILAVVSFVVAYSVVFVLHDGHMYVVALIRLIVFMVVYLGGSILFKMESFRYVKELLPMFLSKFKNKNK